MKILVVGLGAIGQRHVRNLRTLAAAVQIAAYRVRGHDLPSDLKGEWLLECTDLQEALNLRPVAALVCNPTSAHLDVALAAARAGCHLLIEKPISHTLEGVRELQAVARHQDLQVLVGFQFRFHPGLGMIRQLLAEEAIGRVIYAHAHWGEYLPEWHPWEDYRGGYSARLDLGGGVILTLCHPFDYLRWFMGNVRAVTAMARHVSDLEVEVEDTANVLLEFETGILGSVHLDYVQSPATHHLEIVGEQGTIRWDNTDGAVWVYRRGQSEEVLRPPAGFDRNQMFLEEMRHFLDCLAGKAKPLVTLEDGIRALEVALAARRSADEGRTIDVKDVWSGGSF